MMLTVPIAGGGWSSPVLNGTRPSPRSDFTFTLITTNQAIVFAGLNWGQSFNDTVLIDFQSLVG